MVLVENIKCFLIGMYLSPPHYTVSTSKAWGAVLFSFVCPAHGGNSLNIVEMICDLCVLLENA